MSTLPPVVSDDRLRIGPGQPLLLIAGLCVLEEPDATLRQATALKKALADLPVQFVFKASFDKANRSSVESYRGPGLEEGLALLQRVGKELDLPLLTDLHETGQAKAVAEVVDILQIPAFLCRQTDLLLAAAHTGRIVNVKKGQWLAPDDVRPLIEKIRSTGNDRVTLTERGTSFGYNTLVNDFRALPIMRGHGAPVIFDATHSVQKPGGHGSRSGGDRTMVPPLARAAAAVGVEGFFFEVHEEPDRARSDRDNALRLDDLAPLVRQLLAIREAAGTA